MEAQIMRLADATGLVQFTVVDGKDLKRCTEQGWVLVAVLQESVVEAVRQAVPIDLQKEVILRAPSHHPTMDRNMMSTFHTWDVPVVLPVCRYLIGLREDSVLANLNKRIAELDKALQDSYRACGDERSKGLALDGELKAAKERLDTVAKTNETNFARVATAENIRRKLEQDIAKIRSAIGELKMNEIIGR